MGTFAYCAPEILRSEPCGKEVDLWALGVIIFVLLSGSFPFYSSEKAEAMRQAICDEPDFSAPVWQDITGAAKDLCRGLLQKKRTKRFDLETILNMKWFSEYKAISKARKASCSSPKRVGKFVAYSLTSIDDKQIQARIA